MPSLTAEHVGGRVVIRLNAGVREGRERFTDVLGELLEISDRSLLIRRDDGGEQKIDRADVVAAKPVPPRPVRFSAVAALERVASAHWPAPDSEWIGDWQLRAAAGWTFRANTVLAVGDPGRPLEEAVRYVTDWYGSRGLPPVFSLPLPLSRRLDADLDRLGWVEQLPRTNVMTRELSDWTRPPRADLEPVQIGSAPSVGWLDLVSSRKGGLPQIALSILAGAPKTAFASLYEDGELIAIGRGAVSAGWLGVSLVEVVPEARRRGVATHLFDGLVGWARPLGAERAYLQVVSTNEAATALYHRIGFTDHHEYTYRRLSAA
ncbi:GNAT family N-acetyltransferase [Phytomonospora sp. NPDC050363]|uniref:GNAT family N-acetyltransferase n=1 Tax=Phytomonospora sp. NPDC050363 TaxID=3155642 RepID=UPI0033F111FF